MAKDLGSTLGSALLKSSGNSRPADRALGAAATLGISIVIMRMVAKAMKARQEDGEEYSPYQVLQDVFKRLFPSGEEEEVVRAIKKVIHKGFCHCRAVGFELAAPRTIVAKIGPGKISYAHARTKASNFCFVKGTDHLRMYYVSNSKSSREPTVGAHTFCSRCGVHILHAPNPESNLLHVNVSCIEENSKVVEVLYTRQCTLSNGSSVETQWDDDDDDEADESKTWGTMDEFAFPNKLDDEVPMEFESKRSAGTPTTIATTETNSATSLMQARAYALEHGSTVSEGEESVSSRSLPSSFHSLPPLHTRRQRESPGSASTTPMMRDQLKYYISKHLPDRPVAEVETQSAATADQK